MKLFILFISYFSSLFAVNSPLITDGYQLLLSNYDLVQNGDKFNCNLLPYTPTVNAPVINYIPNNQDCIMDNNGNTDCTDTASTLSSVYSVLVVPAYSRYGLIDDSAMRNFDFHYSLLYGYQGGTNSDPLNFDQCVSYISSISIIAQQPVVAPSCDVSSTHLVGMDIYPNGNANTGRCVCNSNYIPSPNPTSCTPYTFNLEQNVTYATVGDVFQNDTQNYAEKYSMISLSGATLSVEYIYDIYHTYHTDIASCNAVDLTFLSLPSNLDCAVSGGCQDANPPLYNYVTMINEKLSNYFYMGNCYTLIRRKTTKGYQGLEVYSVDAGDTGTGTNTDDTGSDTGSGTTDTGGGTNTGTSGDGTTGTNGSTDTNNTGTNTDIDTGTGNTSDTNTTGTNTSTDTSNTNDVLHNDLLRIDTGISSLIQTNTDGFSNLEDVGNGIIEANNNTTDVLKDLRDMNKNDVDADTSFLDGFNSFATDMQTSVDNVENTVNDLMATINGDFTPSFQSYSTCSITYSVYGSVGSFNLCQYAPILRPYFVFILTVYMLILLIRLHLYLFPLVYKSSD